MQFRRNRENFLKKFFFCLSSSVNTHELSKVGQFIIGTSSRINYENTIEFISKNESKSIELYSNYIKFVFFILFLFLKKFPIGFL